MLTVDHPWRTRPAHPVLQADDIHLWRLNLASFPDCQNELIQLLSKAELERARGYQIEQERRNFIHRRGMLRLLLAEYLSMEPCQVNFRYGRFGQPYLEETANPIDLHFSLSYAMPYAIVAFTLSRRIGVDIENLRPFPEMAQVVSQQFSIPEQSAYAKLENENDKIQAFYAGWTRKEAYLKARGIGLAIPLSSIRVRLEDHPGPHAMIQTVEGTSRWLGYPLQPAPGYAGAVVVEGSPEEKFS